MKQKSRQAALALCSAALLSVSSAQADTLPRAPLDTMEAIALHVGDAPLRVGAEIQTTGYLVLGMLYVAGVQLRNKFNSLDFVTALRPRLAQRPLDSAFEAALQDALTRRGVRISTQPPATPTATGVADAPRWSLRVTQLDVEYVAQGSTAAYLPLARARIQLRDRLNAAAAPRVVQVESRSHDPAHAFASYRALNADPERAFDGLELISRRLADTLAESLVPVAPPLPPAR